MNALVLPFINFSLLVGLLYKFGKKPFLDFVSARHHSIREELQKTTVQLREAKEALEDFSAKLNSLDLETQTLRTQAREEIEQLKIRILNDAKRMSDVIVSDANAGAKGQLQALKNDLMVEISDQIVRQVAAQFKSKASVADKDKIISSFSGSLGGVR